MKFHQLAVFSALGLLLVALLALLVSIGIGWNSPATRRTADAGPGNDDGDAAAGNHANPAGNTPTTAPGNRPPERPSVFVEDESPLPTTVPELLADLDRSRAQRRQRIIARLVELGGPDALDRLRRLIVQDPAPAVRRDALNGVVQLRPDDLRVQLERYLDHADEMVRADALRALARLADARSVPPLLAKLDERHYTPRWLVVDALASVKVPAVAAPLARVAADQRETHEVRVRALAFLGQFRDLPEARATIERCRSDRDETIRVIANQLLAN